MTKRLRLAALLLAALAPGPAHPQAATASLEVRVTSGEGLPGVAVRLERNGRVEREGITDGRGRVLFLHLPPGEYRILPSPPDGSGMACGTGHASLASGEHHVLTLRAAPGDEQVPPREALRVSSDRATLFSTESLRTTPRPADPWSILRDVPGVVLDRVSVGGSETAQQSLLVSRGDGGGGAVWTLDGVDITDPAALGFTSLYPDVDALALLQARTGAMDVRVRTPGVQVGLHLREPADRLAGAIHLRGAVDGLQSDNRPSELRSRPFFRNRTDNVFELGAEAGGPVRKDRLWLWGAVARNSLAQDTFTEHGERLRTTSVTGKARLKLGGATLSVLALRAEKVHEDRDTSPSAAPEARWRQSGPVHLIAGEGQRTVGGVSLLGRLSYLDAGFRLEPQGGLQASVFEDFRGILRGSYYAFETERDRLQAGLEAAATPRLLRLDHLLVAGLGYRRSPVGTHLAWPGNKVAGFERQSLFFRAFRLTGFALPTRDLRARSVHDHLEAYVQDTARIGRLTATLGLRLDRLAGRNLASSVEANPVFPDLLPAMRYGGAPGRFRWLDLLGRAGISWDVDGDGHLMARAGYAAYGAGLGSGEITFDNPVGRDFASLAYYWIDRNGDRVVQADELDALRGLLSSSNVDPDNPASTTSPHAIEAGLRSPRTHEVAASLEQSLGSDLAIGLHVSLRRLLHPLWRPLRNFTLSDYVIRGAVRGRLFDRDYAVGYFAPASESRIVPGNGRVLRNREGYRQDVATVEATARGRIGRRVRFEAWAGFTDWRERFDDPERSIQDPTPLDTEPLQDNGPVAVRPGGLGRGDVFVNARFTAGAHVAGDLPWRLRAAARLHVREGFPIPYFEVASTGDPTGGAKNVLIAPRLDSFRLPALVLLDARLARAFPLRGGGLTAEIHVFNLLNRGTTLQVARDIELPSFNRAREILRPRIVRLGLRYDF